MNSTILCKIPTPKKRDAVYLLILVLTVAAFHSSIVFSSHVPLDEDSLLFFYPLRALHGDPNIGFWNPYLFCGFPRDANPQSQLLYAPNAIFSILPTSAGYSLLLAGHLFLGAALMYLLLRGLLLSSESSLFGAFAFLVSTFWRCKITNLGLLEGIAWVPGVLYFFLLSLESGRWTPRMASALLLSMTVFAGVPHTVAYTLIFLLLITFTYIVLRERPIVSSLLGFLSIFITAAILTIGMWLPAYMYLPESARSPLELSNALEGSIGFLDSWKIFLGGLSQPEITRCDPWEGTCCLGATALFFIPAGFMIIQKRLRIAFGLSLLFAFLCTLGSSGWLFPFLHQYLPGWNTINMPNRSLMIAAIVLPILAAYGFQSWFDVKSVSRLCRISLLVLCLILLAGVTWICFSFPEAWKTILNSSLTRTFQPDSITDSQWTLLSLALWTGLTALVVLLITLPKTNRWLPLVLLLLMVAAQSALYSPRLFLQTVSPSYFNPPRSLRLASKALEKPGYRLCSYVPMIDTGSDVRMDYLRPAMMQRLPEVYRVREIQGYDPFFPKRYGELIREWAGHSRATDSARTIRLDRLPKRLLDFLSVSAVIGYPNQEILYSGKTVEIDEPGRIVSPLKLPKMVESVSFRWLLAGAADIPQGALVARIDVLNVSETVQSFPVRAGMEIANYITEYPEAPALHKPAEEFRWFPVPSRYGYLKICQYRAVFTLKQPSMIDQVAIDLLSPAGRLAILEIDLQTPESQGLILTGSSAELPVYENPDAFPPAYLTRRITRYVQLNEMIGAIQSINPDEEIPVFFPQDEDIPFESSPVNIPRQEPEIARYERPDSDRISIQTESKYDSLLVVTENYSPNWSVKIDGKSAPVHRANHTFMAIPIAAGEHQVLLTYLPRLFFVSISIGGSMLAFVILLLALHPNRWLISSQKRDAAIKS